MISTKFPRCLSNYSRRITNHHLRTFTVTRWSRVHGSELASLTDCGPPFHSFFRVISPIAMVSRLTSLESCRGDFSRRIDSFDIEPLSRILTFVPVLCAPPARSTSDHNGFGSLLGFCIKIQWALSLAETAIPRESINKLEQSCCNVVQYPNDDPITSLKYSPVSSVSAPPDTTVMSVFRARAYQPSILAG